MIQQLHSHVIIPGKRRERQRIAGKKETDEECEKEKEILRRGRGMVMNSVPVQRLEGQKSARSVRKCLAD
jgi:hypothetical protein